MKKPVEAIERMRSSWKWNCVDEREILAYLDSIPSDAIPVVWPKELTRERLFELSHRFGPDGQTRDALRALAAIAPERKKRIVYLYERDDPLLGSVKVWSESSTCIDPWKRVAGPVEIDE